MSAVHLAVAAGLALPLVVVPTGYVDRADAPTPSTAKIVKSIDRYSTDGSVELVEPPRQDGTTTVLTIGSDVLFAFGSADLDPAALAAVGTQADHVPQGAEVSVVGHTDSRGGDAVNLPLSSARAEAVAAVLRASRPDLVLAVGGAGSSEPVASEYAGGAPDPEAMARNRRVEIRWATG